MKSVKQMLRKVTALLVAVGILTAGPASFTAAQAEDSTRIVTLPVNVTEVKEEAFAGSGVEAVAITSSVQKIGNRAFADCTKLTEVVLPNHDVEIADDAFAGCAKTVLFHAFAGTKNELWALSHGFSCESMDADMLGQTGAMLTRFGIPSSSLQSDERDYATCRLIVKMKGGRLPDISSYQPTEIIQAGRNRFYIQFDSVDNTRQCSEALQAGKTANGVVWVEPDRYYSTMEPLVSQQVVAAGWDTNDPIGFAAYASFVENEGSGSVTVAVLDSGFPSNAAYNGKLLSSKGRSFSLDGRDWRYDGCRHGQVVAAVLAECVGSANVKILPVRIADGAGRVDTISLLAALDYVEEQGAQLINLSVDYEDPNFTSEALQDAIDYASAKVVVAAGNFGSGHSRTEYFPARLGSVVSVGAVNPDCQLASYSCTGATYGAPGNVSAGGNSGQGTSFAAPQLTAALALLNLDPYHTVEEFAASCLAVSGISKGMPRLDRLAQKSVVSVSMDNVPDEMLYGDFFNLEWTVLPRDVNDKTVTCVSSNPKVIEVKTNQSGTILISAVKAGTATLTVTSNSNPDIYDQKQVKVVKRVQSLTLQGPEDGVVYMHTQEKLTPVFTPKDATNKTLQWSSSNTSVLTVSGGTLTPKKAGKATVTAKTTDGSGVQATFAVTVKTRPQVSSITISSPLETDNIEIAVDDTLQLSAEVIPELALQTVQWTSLFPQYATVDVETGLVTGVAKGTATIQATAMDDSHVSGYLQITVKPAVQKVTITGPAASVNQGEKLQLKATVTPSDAISTAVTWKSLDTSIATVTSKGLVTGKADGTVKIRATSKANSSVYATYTVRVYGTFPVSFDVNTDDATATLDVTEMTGIVNTPLGTLPVPTRKYYRFTGWYTDADCSSGIQVTDQSVHTDTTPVILYAGWSLKEESGWILPSEVPAGGWITQTSYSYRESTENTASTLNGWIADGSREEVVGSGSRDYANFPSTYKAGTNLYNTMQSGPYSTDTTASRRTVSNVHGGWIYWHWMYNVTYASGTGRAISHRQGNWNADGTSGGNGYYYFYEIKSTVSCPYIDNYYCCSQNIPSYNCHNIIPANADTSNTSGLGTDRFFRFEYYTSTYTDYQTIYKYYRDVSYSSTDPGNGANITNKVTYVKYRPE